MAAVPEATDTEAAPPSSSVTRVLEDSLVGLPSRRVDVAELLEREEVGRVLGALEDEGAGPVHGHAAGERGGIGAVARLERPASRCACCVP